MNDCKCKTCKCGKEEISELLKIMDDQKKPYTEEIVDGVKIRRFDPLASDHLFKWHWDEEDRWVESLNENDWQFQIDNELPQTIEPGKIIFIPVGVYHRLIKGTTDLLIKIKD